MITYFDTSSLVKLLIEEEGSEQAATVWDRADVVASVVLVEVEARAALASAERGHRITTDQHDQARAGLEVLMDGLTQIEVTGDLVSEAGGLAQSHALRGYDAVHLAAALTVGAEVLSSADLDLCDAAERLALHIANPLAG